MAPPVFVRHLAHYVPDTVLGNDFFEGIMETTDEWIRSRVGIAERRFMADYNGSFPVFEIGRRAVERLMATTDFGPGDIDMIVSCGCNDDLQYPNPGNMLSEHYDLKVPAFHMQNACSSTLYGMEVVRGLLATGAYRNILVVTGEPFTTFADYSDRSSAILFGDAGTAMVLSNEEGPLEVIDVVPNGKGSKVINSTAPGAAPGLTIHEIHPDAAKPEWYHEERPRLGRFQQTGRDVYEFVVKMMPNEIRSFTAKHGMRPDDADWFIGHQANLVMLKALCAELGIAEGKHLHNVERFGNTSSAGWLTVLSENLEAGRFAKDDLILASAFGGGLAWATALLRKS